MGCDGFFVDRRDLVAKKKHAFAMSAHWATVDNGFRLMKMWKVAKRGHPLEESNGHDWRDLCTMADIANIGGDLAPVDLSEIKNAKHDLPLTIGDMMECSDYRSMIVLDWDTWGVQEYSIREIEEIFYSEESE